MKAEVIKELIAAELVRRPDFVNADINEYVAKLSQNAQIIGSFQREACEGFVAYYCNDTASRIAYITLVLVIPERRGVGLGETLVKAALEQSKKNGFTRCRLEVNTNNRIALSLYKKLGFVEVESRQKNWLLEASL
jgi:ribosomal protein S18 acetylase RimI-like enzyme